MDLKTPYRNLVADHSTEEREALVARIVSEGGVHDAVLVTEDGVVLDGHHRLELADGQCEVKVLLGSGAWSDAQRQAFVFRCNLGRRNLSPDQRKEALARAKKVAKALRKEGMTQEQVGTAIGVARRTVSDWLGDDGSFGGDANASPAPDCRVKVPPKERAVILARYLAGETQEQVAADYKVTPRRIGQLIKKERARNERKQAAEANIVAVESGIFHGDFRDMAVAAESVDLILTDPPYDKEAVALYADLAMKAAEWLKPGGWCLAYSGHAHLPAIYAAMAEYLEYGWTFCVLHSGGDQRFRNLKVHNAWKPVLGFYRRPQTVWWDWFKDVASGGREKDLHPWQQAEAEAAHFIEALSPVGGVVLDPFAGSGTVCSAAKTAGRQWLGAEANAEHAANARSRLA